MSFLPKDYKAPVSSNYVKWAEGKNKIRILGPAVVGWVYWNEDKKPIRLREQPQVMPEDIGTDKDGNPNAVRHFWAMPVWNYQDERVQILEVTQTSIMEALQSLSNDDDWGDPMGYDITIKKEGQLLNTSYTITPNKAFKIPKEIQDAFESRKIDLEKMFTGEDPFNVETAKDKPARGKMQAAIDKENYPVNDVNPDDVSFE